MKSNWGVIGGGLCGQFIALRLAEQGHRVTLVEASDKASWISARLALGDMPSQLIHSSDHRMLALLDELGLSDAVEWARVDGQIPPAKETLGSLHGGYRRFLDALDARLREVDVKVVTGRRVTSFSSGTVHHFVDTAHGGWVFDRVVSTLSAATTVELCEQLSTDEIERRRMARDPADGRHITVTTSVPGLYIVDPARDGPPRIDATLAVLDSALPQLQTYVNNRIFEAAE